MIGRDEDRDLGGSQGARSLIVFAAVPDGGVTKQSRDFAGDEAHDPFVLHLGRCLPKVD